MSAPPFAVGAAVTCNLGGPWEHLRGAKLQVLEVRRASTYPGGWAVRLGGAPHLHVPSSLVGSASLAAVVLTEPSSRIQRPIAVAQRAAVRATYRAKGAPARRLMEIARACRDLSLALGFCALIALVKSATSCAHRTRPRPRKALDRARLEAEIRAFCAEHGLDVGEVWSTERSRRVCRDRDAVIHWLRHEHRLSLPLIGSLMSRDHVTILAAVRRHEARLTQREAA